MQTFLPYPNFKQSASVLDMRRLGKQRIEAIEILKISLGKESRWKHHPAVKMWKGYEHALSHYTRCIIEEWRRRGYNDSLLGKLAVICTDFDLLSNVETILPWWLGLDEFHSKHRATLLFKLPAHYSTFGWIENPEYGYLWPTKI